MHRSVIGIIVSVLIVNVSVAASQKVKKEDRDQNYTKVTIMEKGVKRKVLIPNDNTVKNRANTYSLKQATAKEGVLIKFKNPSSVNISEFELKYGLRLKTKMRIGYYVFENVSKFSDIKILENILTNESNIVTVKPNWKMNKKAR